MTRERSREREREWVEWGKVADSASCLSLGLSLGRSPSLCRTLTPPPLFQLEIECERTESFHEPTSAACIALKWWKWPALPGKRVVPLAPMAKTGRKTGFPTLRRAAAVPCFWLSSRTTFLTQFIPSSPAFRSAHVQSAIACASDTKIQRYKIQNTQRYRYKCRAPLLTENASRFLSAKCWQVTRYNIYWDNQNRNPREANESNR